MRIKENLPTLLTTGNIVCGFISIMCVLNQKYEIAAWLIIVAMIFDGFDGKLARLMNTTSKIGAQLDSMADLVTFGIAPAVLMTSMCHNCPTIISWGFGLFFMMCAAYRLARFNAQKEEGITIPRHFFSGLPTTLSGGTVAQLCILHYFIYTQFGTDIVISMLPFIVFVLGVFMVSKIPFFDITCKIGKKQGIKAVVLEFSAAILYFIITPELALSSTLSVYLIICGTYGIIKGKHIKGTQPV
ncbi:MAG: CDP-diacylglycerol--serine O-phosphatidyltransferase [Candidatus Kuenenia sp.]|nr:CDP-diacylglycerol--serine O-phosphatidyltransferase [Candidatus Kuenenia hertensis]